MIGQQLALGQQLLGHFEEGNQVLGIVQVRGHLAHLAVHLGQGGTGQTVLATPQIQQQQLAGHIGLQFRGHGQVDIGDRGEGRDDQ